MSLTLCSPSLSYSRGMYSSLPGPSWSLVWSRTVGRALMVDLRVLEPGEDWVGVVTGGAVLACCRPWVVDSASGEE